MYFPSWPGLVYYLILFILQPFCSTKSEKNKVKKNEMVKKKTLLTKNCSFSLFSTKTLTHVVSKGPWLVVVKVNVALSVCFGEEGVSQNPTWAIEGKVVSMPVPTGP